MLSPRPKLCLGSLLWRGKHLWIEISLSQEDVCLALDYGVLVKMLDALGVQGASGLGVGVRPFCKLHSTECTLLRMIM